MLRSTSSILSVKYLTQGIAAAALTAALIVPAATGHHAEKASAAPTATSSATATAEPTHPKTYADIVRDRLEAEAVQTYTVGIQTVAANATTVDTAEASKYLTLLADAHKFDDTTVRARIGLATAEIDQVETKAAAVAAAKAAAAAAAAAEAQRVRNTPDGARATAQTMMASQYGWGADQFQCVSSLWQKESGWSYTSHNPSSDATGIPQALPGSKMASAGADWRTNAATQIKWGLDYIKRSYGTPCSAWSHSQSMNWY